MKLELQCDSHCGCDCSFTINNHDKDSPRSYYVCPACEGLVFFETTADLEKLSKGRWSK